LLARGGRGHRFFLPFLFFEGWIYWWDRLNESERRPPPATPINKRQATILSYSRAAEVFSQQALRHINRKSVVVVSPLCMVLQDWNIERWGKGDGLEEADVQWAKSGSPYKLVSVLRGDILALIGYDPSYKWAIIWQPAPIHGDDDGNSNGDTSQVSDEYFGYALQGWLGILPTAVVAPVQPVLLEYSKSRKKLKITWSALVFSPAGSFMGRRCNLRM
jgi:hypothetical protein